jgi:hypothetical protein
MQRGQITRHKRRGRAGQQDVELGEGGTRIGIDEFVFHPKTQKINKNPNKHKRWENTTPEKHNPNNHDDFDLIEASSSFAAARSRAAAAAGSARGASSRPPRRRDRRPAAARGAGPRAQRSAAAPLSVQRHRSQLQAKNNTQNTNTNTQTHKIHVAMSVDRMACRKKTNKKQKKKKNKLQCTSQKKQTKKKNKIINTIHGPRVPLSWKPCFSMSRTVT